MSLVETLAWLVDIESETGNEGRICTQVATRLGPRFGENLLRINNSLVVGEPTGKPLVLLVGHLDTVPSQGQVPAHTDGERMFGLGTTDMKSGVAVMIHLLEDLHPSAWDVVGVFYEGEEGPSSGNGLEPVLAKVEWLRTAELAVVLEPCDGEIQLGCNGVINAEVRFVGRSSHSARPWFGDNAISKAGGWLQAMHAREPQVHVVGGLEYREVMSITRASGGIANNVIPPEFVLNLNYRFTPDLTTDQATERLLEACADADEVEIVDVAPAGPVRADHALVDALARASGARIAGKQGWTDVARLGLYGIPGINFGPGETSLAHQLDESVRLSDLDSVYRALFEVLAGQHDLRSGRS